MALMNSNAMLNLNRMTYLMSISEITPQLCISGLSLYEILVSS